MNDVRIIDLGIENLERLFTPAGLPVVNKGAEVPTTSIAILGDAGAGKTTLATALGHALARELGGIALYLTTELASTEIKYKLELLHLDANVRTWKHRGDARVGDLVGQHVALFEDGSEDTPIRRRALEVAWTLTGSTEQPPVRCVVIDAFPLPDADGNGRDEIVGLVQALEGRGIAVVIVQESTGPADYVPFITDIVFHLRFDEDPDTGERIRKLACPKSRYARSFVGPHDTGFDHDRVAVWPDLLPIASLSNEPSLLDTPAPPVFIPLDAHSHVTSGDGGVFLSKFGASSWLVKLLTATPGLRFLRVDCGPLSIIEGTGSAIQVPDSEGAYSLAWSILKMAQRENANAVVVQSIESLLRRSRFRTPLEHTLKALGHMGLLVCVHGARVEELSAIADFVADDKYKARRTITQSAHRPATAWVLVHYWPSSTQVSTREGVADIERMETARRRLLDMMATAADPNEVQSIANNLALSSTELGARSAQLRVLCTLHALGYEALARARIPAETNDAHLAPIVWANVAIGREGEAAYAIARGMRQAPELKSETKLLWAALTAAWGGSQPALDVITSELAATPALLHMIVRWHAARDQWSEVDATIDEVAQRHQLAPLLVTRMHAEARLEGSDEVCAEAAERLADLLKREDLLATDRVAMLHNRGVALARIGKLTEARACWSSALALQHDYEPAARCLAVGLATDE